MRIMLDTQIYDHLATTPGLIQRVNSLQETHVLSIVSTQIQEDELAGMRDAAKAAEVAKLNREVVPTAGAVFGVSKFSTATFGDGSPSGISIDEVRSPSKGHTPNALLATSASIHADVLVTEDARLANRLGTLSPRCKIWSFSALETWINSQVSP